jgi:hypothetical protein
MSSNDILYDIWQSYLASIDCFKIAVRSVNREEYHLLSNTDFLTTPSEKVNELIKKSRSNADDYVILSLWAVFERKLFEYIQRLSKKISDGDESEFKKKVQIKMEYEIEYWKIDAILDLFKVVVKPELIGRAKEIKKYRDWVAHRSPNKQAPPNVMPKTAYDILSGIMKCIESHPELKYAKDAIN